MQRLRQIVWASQNPSKPCSKMLCGPEVVKTNDIAQALNQTIQVQPLGQLLGIQLHSGLYVDPAGDDAPVYPTPRNIGVKHVQTLKPARPPATLIEPQGT